MDCWPRRTESAPPPRLAADAGVRSRPTGADRCRECTTGGRADRNPQPRPAAGRPPDRRAVRRRPKRSGGWPGASTILGSCRRARSRSASCPVPGRQPRPARRPPTGRWPLAGPPRVVRAFDPPPQRWAAGHRGVDLLARDGAVVRAAGAGSVTFAGPLAGRGVVVVTHGDGTRTTYEPVTATVTRGDRVRAGDALGRLTAAGGHCLPLACLHWGRRRGDVYLDPMLLLRRGPARLLPVWAAARDGPALDRTLRRPMAGAADRPSGPRAGPRRRVRRGGWPPASRPVRRLAAAAGLVGLVALASRRRRAQSRVGSSAASSA